MKITVVGLQHALLRTDVNRAGTTEDRVSTHQLLLSTQIRVLIYYKGKRTINVFLFLKQSSHHTFL